MTQQHTGATGSAGSDVLHSEMLPLSVSHVNTAFITLTQQEDGGGTPTSVSSPQKKEVNFLPKPDIAEGEKNKQTSKNTVTQVSTEASKTSSEKDKTPH